jgi:two-component system sensor histidine kinase FlrB
MQPTPISPASLQDAFEVFNALSENLSRSYAELESQVVRLSDELAAARSERLQTLMEKERLANRLQHLLEALPGGVLVVDGAGTIIDHNPAAARMLGEEPTGHDWRQALDQASVQDSENPRQRRLKHGETISISFNSLGDDPGQIVLLTDVSEMRDLQELLNQQKRLSSLGEMVASLAHQIRTPLATALLYTSHLGNVQLADSQRQKFAGRLTERLLHMERQVNDMLVFARMGTMTQSRVHLATLLNRLADSFEPCLAGRPVCFAIHNRSTVNHFQGNEDSLLGILVNLLTNALEAFAGQSGEILMTVEDEPPTRLCITVSDNGPGIAEDAQGHIFEPFFTTRPQGTGLGLAIVDCVVRAHGGEVRCTSAPGKGARFHINLPVNSQSEALPSQFHHDFNPIGA